MRSALVFVLLSVQSERVGRLTDPSGGAGVEAEATTRGQAEPRRTVLTRPGEGSCEGAEQTGDGVQKRFVPVSSSGSFL